jgi:predicted ArsR family transcriptional regulator
VKTSDRPVPSDPDGIATSPSLEQLAEMFGCQTRHDIYRHLRHCGTPHRAGEVAERFGLHRTAARSHLEKLCELGLASTSTRPRPQGGRAEKIYLATHKHLEITLPPRRYDRLARQLLLLLRDSLHGEAAVEQATAIGRAYGEREAVGIVGPDVPSPVTLAVPTVEAWMRRSGYEVTASSNGRSIAVIQVRNCVYGELSAQHPDIVCSFDRGTLCGLLGVDPSCHSQTHALSAGDPYCRHEIRLQSDNCPPPEAAHKAPGDEVHGEDFDLEAALRGSEPTPRRTASTAPSSSVSSTVRMTGDWSEPDRTKAKT